MKNSWTIKIIVITVASFALAKITSNKAGETQLETYWQKIVDKSGVNPEVVSTLSEKTFSSDKLNEINIKTIAIDVRLEKSKDDKVHFYYYKKNDEAENSVINTKDSVMTVQLDKLGQSRGAFKVNLNNKSENYFGIKQMKPSEILLQVPSNIKKIKIETTSGDIELVDLKLEAVQFDSVNGDLKLQGSIEQLKSSSTSGDLELQGSIKQLKSSSVSGDLNLYSAISDLNAELSAVSGSIKIAFNETPNINLKFKTTSGELDFDQSFVKTESKEGSNTKLKFGTGAGQFNINTVSGDVEIVKDQI